MAVWHRSAERKDNPALPPSTFGGDLACKRGAEGGVYTVMLSASDGPPRLP
jgi:hypothetical protein